MLLDSLSDIVLPTHCQGNKSPVMPRSPDSDAEDILRALAEDFSSVQDFGDYRYPDSPPSASDFAPDFVAAVHRTMAGALAAEAKAEAELLAQQEKEGAAQREGGDPDVNVQKLCERIAQQEREQKEKEQAESELRRAKADLDKATSALASAQAQAQAEAQLASRAPGTPVQQLLTPHAYPKSSMPQNASEASQLLENNKKALVLSGQQGRYIPITPGKDGAPGPQVHAQDISTLPPLAPMTGISPANWAATKTDIVEQLKMKIESMDKGLLQAAVISEANSDFTAMSDQAFCQKYVAAAGADQDTWLTLCQNAAQVQLHHISAVGLQRAQMLRPFAENNESTLPEAPSVGSAKRLSELRSRMFHAGVVVDSATSASSTPQEPAAGRRRIAHDMEVDPRDIPVPADLAGGIDAAPPEHSTLHHVSPPARDQTTFTQLIAASQGVDINSQVQVESWLDQPLNTMRDLMPVLWKYHTDLVVAEVTYQCRHVTTMIEALSERTLELQEDLSWLKTQDRVTQKQRAQVMSVAAGFDRKMSPNDRVLQLEWMMFQVPDLVTHCQNQPFFADRFGPGGADPVGSGAILFVCLATDPITVRAGKQWSPLTLLVWRAFELRQKFNLKYQGDAHNAPLWWGNTPVPQKHIKVSPSVPAFQRKLEAPLRVLLTVLNSSEQYKHNAITTLWPSLTVMTPQPAKEFDESHTALARLIITEAEGRCKATLYILFDAVTLLLAPSESGDSTIWEAKWYEQFFGRQWQEDESEKQASAHMQDSAGLAKGSSKGRLNHWVNALTHTARPFPIPFSIVPVGYIPFEWDQYCRKMGRQDQESNPPVAPYRPSDRTLGQFVPGQAASSGGDQANGPGQQQQQQAPYVTTTPPKHAGPSPSPTRAAANGPGSDPNQLQQVIGKASAPQQPSGEGGKGATTTTPPIDPQILAAQQELLAKGKGSQERVSPPRQKGPAEQVQLLTAGDWATKTWQQWSQAGQHREQKYTAEEWAAWKQSQSQS